VPNGQEKKKQQHGNIYKKRGGVGENMFATRTGGRKKGLTMKVNTNSRFENVASDQQHVKKNAGDSFPIKES